MTTTLNFSTSSLAVFRTHYYKKNPDGSFRENSPAEVFERIREFYKANGVPDLAADRLYEFQLTKQFSFNSPVYYNADVNNKAPQLLACFVSDLQDSMRSITDHITRACMIFKTGAGMGFNIGSLRPRGASIGDNGKSYAGPNGSSGPLSFMEVFQAAGNTVMSAGKRRAAMWAGMRYDHPDIMEFARCKRGDGRLKFTNMNISVIVDDKFRDLYDKDGEVSLNWAGNFSDWGTIKARHLMRSIVDSVWAGGDPGLMFLSVVNAHNTTPSLGMIVCFNPCGEICLPPSTSCNLGAVVVYNIIRDLEVAGTIRRRGGTFDWRDVRRPVLDRVREVATMAMAHMDKNIDVNVYPDDDFKTNTQVVRPTGLGLSGLGEAFCSLGVPYGSAAAISIGAEIMNEITLSATEWSFNIVNAEGKPCPASTVPKNAEAFRNQLIEFRDAADVYDFRDTVKRWNDVIDRCEPGAYRNSYVTCIAPTGNTGIAFDAGSGGMEPISGISFQRITRDGNLYFADQEFEIQVGPSKDILEIIYDAFKGSVFNAVDKCDDANSYIHGTDVDDADDADHQGLDKETKDYLEKKYGAGWEQRVVDAWSFLSSLPQETRERFRMMHDVAWEARIMQQEALQQFTSLSISSTINVPHDASPEEIEEIYVRAMQGGILKGVTVYRDGSIQFAPMTMTKDTKNALPDTMPKQKAADISTVDTKVIDLKAVRQAAGKVGKETDTEFGEIVVRKKHKRPRRTVGDTIEMPFTDGIHTDNFYVTINEDPKEPGRPIEIFINGGRHGETTPAMNQALGRVLSGWLQHGAPVMSIVKKLVGIKGDFRSRVWFYDEDDRPTQVLSIPDGIGKLLQRKYLDKAQVISVPGGTMCPKCYHNTFVYAADGQKCWQCHNPDCGHHFC